MKRSRVEQNIQSFNKWNYSYHCNIRYLFYIYISKMLSKYDLMRHRDTAYSSYYAQHAMWNPQRCRYMYWVSAQGCVRTAVQGSLTHCCGLLCYSMTHATGLVRTNLRTNLLLNAIIMMIVPNYAWHVTMDPSIRLRGINKTCVICYCTVQYCSAVAHYRESSLTVWHTVHFTAYTAVRSVGLHITALRTV